MFKTKDKAIRYWCPFTRFVGGSTNVEAPVNRWGDDLNPPAARCIANDCMAWRWAFDKEGFRLKQQDGEPMGYCGLVGKPEN